MNYDSQKEVVRILFDLELAFDRVSELFKELARIHLRDFEKTKRARAKLKNSEVKQT